MGNTLGKEEARQPVAARLPLAMAALLVRLGWEAERLDCSEAWSQPAAETQTSPVSVYEETTVQNGKCFCTAKWNNP